ncbi:MAG: hypothetical protein GC185_07575 [Alphaproteobacteria bacterium]|nr:hypothetical protein [Alphaproteobacteria bacterium]
MRDQPFKLAGIFPHLRAARAKRFSSPEKQTAANLTPEAAQCIGQVAIGALDFLFSAPPENAAAPIHPDPQD